MKLSVKQTRALDHLENAPTSEVLYGGSAGCFVGDTLVQTSQGHKKIKEILAGDLVLSYNQSSKKTEYKPVVKIYLYNTINRMIRFNKGLECTATHKFLFGGKWIEAENLEKVWDRNSLSQGYKIDNFSTEISRLWLRAGLVSYTSNEPVYDLQVADNHNYTVTKDNIIVHNSGKSFLLSYASLKWCYKYAGIRGLLGRKTRSTLYKTTVKTLLEVASMQGLKRDIHYTLNTQANIFKCYNGSEILLYNLETNPSDPNYDELGSLEITFANIDECPQVEERLVEIVKSRIRYRLRDFCQCGLETKTMKVTKYDKNNMPCEWYCPACKAKTTGIDLGLGLTANPTKNWVKRVYYDPHVNGKQQEHKVFVQALPTDNKYLDPVYLKNLANLNSIDKQRLLEGNWNYADDDTQLIKTPQLNTFLEGKRVDSEEPCYISADIALMGADLFVIVVWRGWHVLDVVLIPKSNGQNVIDEMKYLAELYKIPTENMTYDADGSGGFIGGFLKDAIPFQNGSSAIVTEDDEKKNEELKEQGISFRKTYQNLKTQCAYMLAEKINTGEATIEPDVFTPATKERTSQELSMLRRDKVDDDSRLYMLKKEEVKKALGRSPDISDALLMRCIFELKKNINAMPYAILTKI